jgi:hypothetical protein
MQPPTTSPDNIPTNQLPPVDLKSAESPSTDTTPSDEATTPDTDSSETATPPTEIAEPNAPAAKRIAPCKPSKFKKCKPAKMKVPRMTPVTVSEGTLTVNGMIARVGINDQIPDLKYLYFWVPYTGVVIVTDKPFPGAIEQKEAFHAKGLTIKVPSKNPDPALTQSIELYSDDYLLKNDRRPLSAWVLLDSSITNPADISSDPHFKGPIFGWGDSAAAPYAWPGSLPTDPKKHTALAPPIPVNLLPILAKKTVPVSLGSTQPAQSTAAAAATPPASAPPSTPPAAPAADTPTTSAPPSTAPAAPASAPATPTASTPAAPAAPDAAPAAAPVSPASSASVPTAAPTPAAPAAK